MKCPYCGKEMTPIKGVCPFCKGGISQNETPKQAVKPKKSTKKKGE